MGRMLKGLVLGVVLGGIVGALAIKVLGWAVIGALPAYLLAVITGALTGLVAGKPIWAAEAKLEAGLKSFAGALLAVGAMFALRRWVGLTVDLEAFGAGKGTLGELSATSLPIISAVLAMLFELDNTGGSPPAVTGKKRVEGSEGEAAADEAEEAEDLEQSGRRDARRS